MSTDEPTERRRALPARVELWREGGERRRRLLLAEIDLGADRAFEAARDTSAAPEESQDYGLLETDALTLEVTPESPLPDGVELRFLAGNVPIASTAPEGPHEMRLILSRGIYEARGHPLFLDCAGYTSLTAATRWPDEEASRCVGRWPLRVLPAKITLEELERLVDDLEDAVQGVTFDAYAKTLLGLKQAPGSRPAAPAEKLERIAGLLDVFGAQLARISNRPAQRLTLSPRRVLISPGDAITPETSIGISEDTSLLARTATGVLPKERIEMAAERDVRLPEHAALSGFLASLADEIRELLDLIRSETALRLERRRFFAAGEHGIWADREEPRVAALRALESRARLLFSRTRELRRRHEFLPADSPPLRRPPELTKRFAHVGAYYVLYRAMREHHRSHRVQIEGGATLVGAKSLPVLWEYWVTLRVIRFLQRRLRYATSPWEASGSLFRRVVGFRDRYVLDLTGDRAIELADESGRRILFRYQPRYPSLSMRGAVYGRLKRRAAPYEPDIAIEIYASGAEERAVPEHIVLLDAKYSSRSHEDILDDILRYRNIGEFGTGRRLVRQIWAVTNVVKEPAGGPARGPQAQRGGLEGRVTVDNEVFLEEGFSGAADACGVVGVRPGRETAEDPLETLLGRVLKLLGVEGRK